MGLTPARASALSILVFGGPATIGSLARAEQVSAPTVTPDDHDGRMVWLHPTPKGTKLLHEGRRRRVAALATELAALNAADRDTLGAAADIIERMLAGGGGMGRKGGTGGKGRMGGMGRKGGNG